MVPSTSLTSRSGAFAGLGLWPSAPVAPVVGRIVQSETVREELHVEHAVRREERDCRQTVGGRVAPDQFGKRVALSCAGSSGRRDAPGSRSGRRSAGSPTATRTRGERRAEHAAERRDLFGQAADHRRPSSARVAFRVTGAEHEVLASDVPGANVHRRALQRPSLPGDRRAAVIVPWCAEGGHEVGQGLECLRPKPNSTQLG